MACPAWIAGHEPPPESPGRADSVMSALASEKAATVRPLQERRKGNEARESCCAGDRGSASMVCAGRVL